MPISKKKVFGPLGTAKKGKDVFTREERGFDTLTSKNALSKVTLRLLHLQDPLLNGSLDNELENAHVMSLANAVGSVGRLILGSGVPPRVIVDDDVRGREIESDAAGFKRDKENVAATRLKSPDEPLARFFAR